MANENSGWGYDRIVGALANLGHTLSDETVGNILRRKVIPPAHQRKQTTTWKDFIRAHMAVLAGTDFFTVEVLTLPGPTRPLPGTLGRVTEILLSAGRMSFLTLRDRFADKTWLSCAILVRTGSAIIAGLGLYWLVTRLLVVYSPGGLA